MSCAVTFAHHLGAEVVVRDGTAFITDDGQEDYLPVASRHLPHPS
ncbi:hypothetical protein [Streptomyces sp. NBC_01618]|nr:hypothetical protein OH735_04085 [Streptomyces sp. NBC_01618]